MINSVKKVFLGNNEKILVYGDLIIDVYKESMTNRISSESPIPVFEDLDNSEIYLGGAGNVLNNLIKLNSESHLLTISQDKYIDSLISRENLININDKTYKNAIKTRYFCLNQNAIRIDSVNKYTMCQEVIDNFKKIVTNNLKNYKVVIISDYNTGVVNDEITKFIINEANKLNITTIVDPKNKYRLYENCTIIKSNKNDAEKFSKKTIHSIDDAFSVCAMFILQLKCKECIITLSEKGCVYMNATGESFYVKTNINNNAEIMDITGAGDTFVSTFAVSRLNELPVEESLKLCNLFCSDVIKRKYVSTVDMLNIFKMVDYVFDETDFFILKQHLISKKTVFTTGCFDLLHEGHIETFKIGKELGDILIVALNTDDSIKRLKGKSRPINNLTTRLSVLRSIKYIDFIIVFDNDSPNHIYNTLEPDILLKGGDYSLESIEKIYKNVKQFISVPLINNINSSNIINKIKNS